MENYVFDLDGTLIDSAPDIIWSLEFALKEVGINYSVPIPSTVVGPPVIGMLKKLNLVLTEDQEAKAVAAFRRHYDTSLMPLTKPYVGAIKLLMSLKQRGGMVFLATNKPKLPTAMLINRFFSSELIYDFCCIDSIEGKKLSKLQMLEELTRMYGLKSSDSVMIGDGPVDIAAGNALGWKTVAVKYGYGTEEELSKENPTYWVDSLSEAPRGMWTPHTQ